MATATLPPAESIPQLSADEQTKLLDLLFEPSVALHQLILDSLRTTRFLNYEDLIASVQRQLEQLLSSDGLKSREQLDSIIGAHPRLGEKKVDSAQSRSEQAHLKADSETDETAQLAALNSTYELTFPGLRYVTFVDGRTRPEIMDEMQRRIAAKDIEAERKHATQALCDIARDRSTKLLG